MTLHSQRVRRAGVGSAVAALVGSGLLFTSTAQAVTFETITQLDVNTDDTRATGHNDFLAGGGVRVYTEGSDNTGPNGAGGTWNTDKAAAYFRVDKPLSTVGEPAMNWAAQNNNGGSNLKPSVQLVVDYNGDGSADGILVGEPTYADGTLLYGNDWWLSNGSKAAFKALAPVVGGGFGSENHGTLDQWRTKVPNARVLKSGWSLGSGVKGDGVISQIKIGDTVYRFAPAATSTQVVHDVDVDQSATRATGHHVFSKTSGVRVFTEGNTNTGPRTDGQAGTWNTDKAAGYFAIGLPLAKAGKPSLDWTPAAGQTAVPGNQLKVDFDGDGSVDGTLVGEPAYGSVWWLADSKAFVRENAPATGGGQGSSWFGTVGMWSDAFPNATIVQGGWSLGSGVKGDGVIEAITVGAVTYTFAAKNNAPVVEAVTASTRAGDAVEVELSATDPDDDDIVLSVSQPEHGSAELQADGVTVRYTPDGGFSGTDGFTYTADDGRGSSTTAAVSVAVVGNNAPVVSSSTVSTKAGQAVSISLPATDADGDALTYSVTATGGSVSGTGTTRTFTPSSAFSGRAVVKYTVTDARGAAATATVTVRVAKLSSSVSIYRINPTAGKRTTKRVVSVYATVTIDGKAAPKGTVVDVFAKGKRIRAGQVDGQGKVKISAGRLVKGKSTLKVAVRGTSTVVASSDSTAVRVR